MYFKKLCLILVGLFMGQIALAVSVTYYCPKPSQITSRPYKFRYKWSATNKDSNGADVHWSGIASFKSTRAYYAHQVLFLEASDLLTSPHISCSYREQSSKSASLKTPLLKGRSYKCSPGSSGQITCSY